MAKRSPKPYWVVIRTKNGQERSTAANVENHGHVESYSPRFREYGRVKALFPGYAFAKVNQGNWSFLLRIKGVRGILMAGERPSVVKDEVIDGIRAGEVEPDIIDLKKSFTPRQKLGIVGGPFTRGLYLGMSSRNRVRVLFELLGKETEKDIDIKRVRPLEAS